MICNELSTHTYLGVLVVGKTEQRRGIGSSLIGYCIDNARKPIYLVSYSQLKNFYYDRGFVDADYSNMPRELSRWRQHQNMQIMVFDEINE